MLAIPILNFWTLKEKQKTYSSQQTDGSVYSLHDLLLQSSSRYQPEDRHYFLLADAVSSIHGLQILHRVPVVLHENHRISASQVETEASHVSRHQQNIDGRIRIEPDVKYLTACRTQSTLVAVFEPNRLTI